MSKNYEWLTSDEAVEVLKNGGEVINEVKLIYGEIENYLMNKEDIDNVEKNVKWSKFRKPLTPEQVIASGTPLLAEGTNKTEVFRLYTSDTYPKNDMPFMFLSGKTRTRKDIKFITNKNGNYLTIKDGVAEEVLR